MQEQPQPPPEPGPIDVHIDLSGLANLIWQSFVDHITDLGAAIWTPLSHTLLDGLQRSAQAVWTGVWSSSANIVTQLPPDLTYNLPAYRAIATDPVPLAIGGATLALVLLGLRTMFGAMVGRDHVITHVSGRLIPAVFLTLAYPVLLVQAFGLLNSAATSLGLVPIGDVLVWPNPQPGLEVPAALLFLLLIWYALRLVIRLAYSLFRLLVALVFGPVALILWAIPQTEWVTWFWLREVLGWATTPLLVTACLAMAIPFASGRSGFLAAIAFGIAGFQAAYDVAGLLSYARGGGGGSGLMTHAARTAAASFLAGGGAGVAAASIPANRVTTLADQFGYQ
jgi:hypothetical protein